MNALPEPNSDRDQAAPPLSTTEQPIDTTIPVLASVRAPSIVSNLVAEEVSGNTATSDLIAAESTVSPALTTLEVTRPPAEPSILKGLQDAILSKQDATRDQRIGEWLKIVCSWGENATTPEVQKVVYALAGSYMMFPNIGVYNDFNGIVKSLTTLLSRFETHEGAATLWTLSRSSVPDVAQRAADALRNGLGKNGEIEELLYRYLNCDRGAADKEHALRILISPNPADSTLFENSSILNTVVDFAGGHRGATEAERVVAGALIANSHCRAEQFIALLKQENYEAAATAINRLLANQSVAYQPFATRGLTSALITEARNPESPVRRRAIEQLGMLGYTATQAKELAIELAEIRARESQRNPKEGDSIDLRRTLDRAFNHLTTDDPRGYLPYYEKLFVVVGSSAGIGTIGALIVPHMASFASALAFGTVAGSIIAGLGFSAAIGWQWYSAWRNPEERKNREAALQKWGWIK